MITQLITFLFVFATINAFSFIAKAETIECVGQTSFKQGPSWGGGSIAPDKPVSGITIVKTEKSIQVLKDGQVFKGIESESVKKKMRFGKDNDGWKFNNGKTSYQIFANNGKCEIKVFTDRLCPNIDYKFNFESKIAYVNRNNIIYRVQDDSGYGIFYQYVSYLKTKPEITNEEKENLKNIFEDLNKNANSSLSKYRVNLNDPKKIDLEEVQKDLKKADIDIESNITNEYWKKTSKEKVTNYLSDPSERAICKNGTNYELNDEMDTSFVDGYFAQNSTKPNGREERRRGIK